MAEPLSNINDAGSPVPTGADRLNVAGEAPPRPPVLPGMPDPDHLLPEGDRGSTRLNAAAERVGGAVGSAVGSVRRARLRVVGGRDRSSSAADTLRETADRARDKVSDLADTASDKLSDLKDSASERFDDLRVRTNRGLSQFAATARDRAYYARIRARHLVNEYPLQAIAGFGVLAFMVGFTLRIWRSNGD